jgi:hypothetical protein
MVGVACGTLFLVGCTRQRPQPSPVAAGTPGPINSPPSASIVITSPSQGARVDSPVLVEGTMVITTGLTVAAQVKGRDASGQLQWLGNQSLTVDEAGHFRGAVDYVLASPSPGVVEVIVADPASGAVIHDQSVDVSLGASR